MWFIFISSIFFQRMVSQFSGISFTEIFFPLFPMKFMICCIGKCGVLQRGWFAQILNVYLYLLTLKCQKKIQGIRSCFPCTTKVTYWASSGGPCEPSLSSGHCGFSSPVTLFTVCYHFSVIAQLASLVTSYPVAGELSVESREKNMTYSSFMIWLSCPQITKLFSLEKGRRMEDRRSSDSC